MMIIRAESFTVARSESLPGHVGVIAMTGSLSNGHGDAGLE